jgi:hypothetical protein
VATRRAALGASIFTEADDVETLHEQVKDAVRCHFGEGGPRASGPGDHRGCPCVKMMMSLGDSVTAPP